MLNVVKSIKARLKSAQELEALENQLLQTLYRPAMDAGFFEAELDGLEWMSEDCNFRASSMQLSLRPLADYYAANNPALSAALWGIWNSIERLGTLQSYEVSQPREQDHAFARMRKLMVDAATQFADGDPFTVVALCAGDKTETNKHLATRAIGILDNYPRVA